MSAYNNIGLIDFNQGNNTEAMKYYRASLKIAEEIKSNRAIAVNHDNIGEVYRSMGNYPEAMQYHLLALKIGEEIKYTYGVAYSYINIGQTYFLQTNYDEALKNYFSALKLFEKAGEIEGKAKVNVAIGETYFKLNKFPEAKQYFNDALLAAKEFQGKRIIKNSYENLARVDSAKGNWESAFRNHNLSVLYSDSMINDENRNKITETRLEYEFSKKEDSL